MRVKTATALEPPPSSTNRPARLLGDIGGTHARFAWQATDGAELTDQHTVSTQEHPSLEVAIRAYLKLVGHEAPAWCSIGIANPITGDEVRMTNGSWSFSIAAVKQALGFERFVVINDFTALALAIPALEAAERRQIGGGAAAERAPIAVIGPGTGLGVSGLLPSRDGNSWIAVEGEGGHATLAATSDREAEVLGVLRDRFGHVSAERAVSGQGLEALHAALRQIAGEPGGALAQPLTAEEISRHGLTGSDAQAVEALDLFCGFLGNVAGNLALTLGARGGVYLGGGIVPQLGTAFESSRFRAAFEDKGRFMDYLAAIPVYLIEAKTSPALRGAAQAL